jgi:Skp family chaperone for outer membrane proteins
MKFRKVAFAALAAVSLGQVAAPAFAQTKVFIINEAKVRKDSKIGKDIAAKLGESQKDGVTKLGLEALANEIKTAETALKPQIESLTPEAIEKNATLKARVEELNKKRAEYVQKSRFLDANLDQAQGAGMIAFEAALAPAVDVVAKQVGADVVLSAASTWYIKDAVDISQKVIQQLDDTTPTLDALRAKAEAAQPRPQAGAPPKTP